MGNGAGEAGMETEWQIAWYMIWYNGHIMNDLERRAFAHLISTMKMMNGRSDPAAQEEAIQSHPYSNWLSWDPDVLSLASVGYKDLL